MGPLISSAFHFGPFIIHSLVPPLVLLVCVGLYQIIWLVHPTMILKCYTLIQIYLCFSFWVLDLAICYVTIKWAKSQKGKNICGLFIHIHEIALGTITRLCPLLTISQQNCRETYQQNCVFPGFNLHDL